MNFFLRVFKYQLARRIALVIIGALFAFIADFAFAEIVPATKYYVSGQQFSKTRITPQQSCEDHINTAHYVNYTYNSISQSTTYPSQPTWSCRGTSISNGSVSHVATTYEVYHCDNYEGATISLNTYPATCNVPDAPPPQCESGCNGACGSNHQFTSWGSTSCIEGCIYNLGYGFSVTYASGQESIFFDVKNNTGQTCTDSPNPPSAGPEQCDAVCECTKKGKSHGTINGVVVCVEAGTENTPPITTQPPPVVTTHTPAPTAENPNPEPVVTETTPPKTTIGGSGGTGVTGQPNPDITHTTTNPDGSTTTTTQDKETFCSLNPTHALCAAKTDCDKNPNAIACLELGDSPESEELMTVERAISSISLPSLPETNSCPADDVINLSGKNIPLSYEPFCSYASAFKPLVLAAAWLSAAFIVVGFRRDE